MSAYYNEIDPYCVQWLRNLIAADLIAPGDVDDRSIADVRPADVAGYRQCHWFAGIGGWSLAARLADWPDDRELWTGSCPCQPFSAAGKRKGTADARHLWPEFARLIGECRPAIVVGEQVASKDGRLWLAGVRADLETLGYEVGAGDICAAGVGAPHIRQRLYWVADNIGIGREVALQQFGDGAETTGQWQANECGGGGTSGRVADANGAGSLLGELDGEPDEPGQQAPQRNDADGRGAVHGLERMGYAMREGLAQRERYGSVQRQTMGAFQGQASWGTSHTIACADGKTRRIEPSIFPLAHAGEWGTGSRVGLLRGSGNAIVPQVAAEFLGAYMDCQP